MSLLMNGSKRPKGSETGASLGADKQNPEVEEETKGSGDLVPKQQPTMSTISP